MDVNMVYKKEAFACPITYPTWQRTTIMYSQFRKLDAKHKRKFFACLRNDEKTGGICPHMNSDCYFPHFGITIGDFALMQQLGACARSSKN